MLDGRATLCLKMSGKLQTIDRRLLARQCVACGYDGALLKGGQASQCARCGCDLRERPARSYAEMEGLLCEPITLHAPRIHGPGEARLIHRWLAFLFLAMLSFVVLLYLSAAAFTV